ncbi:MAG: UDP-3-O-(3-hydroxymyristoyl)glucosamine N-acyltransferase [Proteobacteria bacterium]|nr:MAG: UDP-3-O-(3-hydroxymyristoyl)glucosamine N-acyltransferase [Pseudomonadota bacterium]
MSITLGELAVRFGVALQGDPEVRVSRVASLEHADADAVAFLANPRWRRFLAGTRAGAVVLDPQYAAECPVPALLANNPYAVYARIAGLLHPPPVFEPGVDPGAVVDPRAQVDPSAHIGANAVVQAGARIGPRVAIGPGCVVMRDAEIGADTRLVANVTLCPGVRVGERCLLHPGAVIGADGFGFAPDREGLVKIPQIGSVRIGNDVEIGANTTVDRGAIEDTVIGDGVKLDNLVQIGHNVHIGPHTALAACSGVSGSTKIGARCMFGGQTGIAGHLTICDDVTVTGKSLVTGNIRKPGTYSGGLPIDETARFRKNAARFHQLDELARQLLGLIRSLRNGQS